MKDNSLVTIIIPSYNHAQYIGEAIQSILNQTYRKWELIVIDDVSPDNTFEISQSLLRDDIRATLIRKEVNRGAVDSYNIGIAMAKGDYIAFLASDDAWEPDFLSVSIECAQKHKDCIVFSNAKDAAPFFNREGLIPPEHMRNILLRCNPIIAISCLYPSTFIKTLIPFDPEIYLEDYYIRWQAVFNKMMHYYTNAELVRYRVLDASMSRKTFRMAEARLKLVKSITSNLSVKEVLLFATHLSLRTLKSLF